MALDSSICAGELTHRLRIQRKNFEQTLSGAMLNLGWFDLATVWGRIVPLTGYEMVAAQQISSKLTSKARIRYRTDVDATMRIVCRGVFYNIGAVIPDERFADHLTLLLSSGVNNG